MAVHGIEDMILLKQLIKTTGNILLVSNYSHFIEYYLFKLLKLLTLFLRNGVSPANDSPTHIYAQLLYKIIRKFRGEINIIKK